MHAILLVGGKGTRLAALLDNLPKALIRVGPHPILEIALRRLRACGFDRITLCVSHLREMIEAEIGDGSRLGLSVDYVVDHNSLGTAAPLSLVPDWTEPAVVMNGDVLSVVDFAALHRSHVADGNAMTVAYLPRAARVSVGLLEMAGDRAVALREKPSFDWNVSCGIYVADPLVRKYLPEGERTDMPALINTLIDKGEPVRGYRVPGAWHDVGTPDRYRRACTEFEADPQLYLDPAAGRAAPPTGRTIIDVELT
ncbi:hypothetical protein Acy02nite_40660 [Actinoplanes cyaneus]|uniref:Nucleotidyl transferase domain-containing protein n=1 Tax=Actinoplanes cyaneus TaxID=52696 RepID=A0A919M1G9_9ACTN|nr:sugar phosphate nucleotidyltransferase [Actinoplanes cyaneus]MCW2138227.1 NDP-sugar pyrophosphorylase, includes eIF-2Bgamma, eIF-2Bepsilon, and LPS biosynthesis proteins [Actinoplanes cyaneus]GID66185.1 hypothetical protein Acy02nite_40660 [Actinoplanes cyaneus]